MASLWALAGPRSCPDSPSCSASCAPPRVIFAAAVERALIPVLAPVLGAATSGSPTRRLAGRRGEGSSAPRSGRSAGSGSPRVRWRSASAATSHPSRTPVGRSRPPPPTTRYWCRSGTSTPSPPPLAFGLAAWAMGPIVRARHVAPALVGAVLWAAGLTAAIEALEPAVASTPIVALAAVTLVIWLDRRPSLVLKLEGAGRIEAKLDPKTGATVPVKGKVERREGLAGDVALTLTGLPPGTRADVVTVKAGVSDFTVNVILPPNLPAGEVKGLKLAGTAAPDARQPNVRVRSREAEVTLVVRVTGK